MHRLGNEEEREKTKKRWYNMRREAGKKMLDEIKHHRFLKIFELVETEEEIPEERKDVYIYKTLRYPPKSTPPTAT